MKRAVIFFVLIIWLLPIVYSLDVQELPIKTKLYFKEKPIVGEPTELILELDARKDVSNVRATIMLSDPFAPEQVLFDKFELINGSLEWSGDLKKGEVKEIKMFVVAKKSGYYNIRSNVFAEGYHGRVNSRFPRVLDKVTVLSKGYVGNGWASHCGFDRDYYHEAFKAKLSASFTSLPKVGETVGLIVEIKPEEDVNNSIVVVTLPSKGFDVISAESTKLQRKTVKGTITINKGYEDCPNSISWDGNLASGEVLMIKAQTKVKSEGWGNVVVRLRKTILKNETIFNKGIESRLNVLIDEDFTKMSGPVCSREECIEFKKSIEGPLSIFKRLLNWIKRLF